MHNKILNRNG